MTAYQGGKKRIGRRIHDVIALLEEDLWGEDKLDYFEPFVGMAGVLGHFGKEGDRRIAASDINKDLILMWKAVQRGWNPPIKCSKKHYEELKRSKKHSAERAFIGICASYGCNFFSNYRLHLVNKGNRYLKEGKRGLQEIRPNVKNVKFSYGEYTDWGPENFLIYCDPPYANNKLGPDCFKNFDSKKFWDVMRDWGKNNLVVVSESTAPKDFKKVWCTRSTYTNQSGSKKYPDCLFIHSSWYNNLSATAKRKIRAI